MYFIPSMQKEPEPVILVVIIEVGLGCDLNFSKGVVEGFVV